jgi:hypothetical protein
MRRYVPRLTEGGSGEPQWSMRIRAFFSVVCACVVGCSASGSGGEPLGGGDAGGDTSLPIDGAGSDSTSGFDVARTDTEGGIACTAPDMLIALDRTLTMHFDPTGLNPTDAPDYKSSKWYQAVTAIKALATPPLDTTIRFGLELWPREAPGCITLAERITDTKPATNPACETGEVLVAPQLSAGAKMSPFLDPAKTKICTSTPTGDALILGADTLLKAKEAGRDQYLVLVTDGADWDFSCPTPNPLDVTTANAAKGIKTYVVGFSATADLGPSGVGTAFLNDMACAGGTAPEPAKNCKSDGKGGQVAVDAKAGPVLFLQANDGAALAAALQKAAKAICCDCPR